MRHVRHVAVLLSLVACSKAERGSQSSDSAAGATAASNAQPAALAQQQRRPQPGDLAKPLNQYTGAELSAFVDSLQYIRPVTRQRRCRDAAGCGGGVQTRNTQVRVEAVGRQDSVGGVNVGPFGTIVSRGRNIGAEREERYGMRQGGRYQYFLIILPDTGGTNRWQIEELDGAGNNRTHTPLATGRVRGCGHQWVPGDPRVDFRRCEQGPLIRQASFVQGTSIDDPWWYSCLPHGCCEASDQ